MNIIDEAKLTLQKYKTGAIKGERGYAFQVYKFLTTAYLYNHGVDVSNPDLLGINNPNTQQNNWQAYTEKIKEQVRIDMREIGFVVKASSPYAEYVFKAANTKTLTKDNQFTEEWERATDDAVDYGSGFLKIYKKDGKLKIKALDPFAFAWNIYNFDVGVKMHQIKTTVNEMMKNKTYDETAKAYIFNEVDAENRDDELILWQVAKPSENGYDIYIVSLDYEQVLWGYEDFNYLGYIKLDLKKRRGFKDTLGVGAIEVAFNSIVKDKVARERLDRVQELASILMYQKVVGEDDKIAGKKVQKFGTGTVLALNSPDEALTPVNTSGGNQINALISELQALNQDIQAQLRIPDVLNGDANNLVNSSGVAINYLQEFASSTHKDVKKRLARQLEKMYREWFAPYMLSAFDSEEALEEHLTKSDYQYLQTKAVDFLLAKEQINQLIKGNFDYNPEDDRKKFTDMVKKDGLKAGGLLDELKSKVSEIQISVSGEKASVSVKEKFFKDLQAQYYANPELFMTPFNIELVKRNATLTGVLTEIEVDDLINKLQQKT